MEWERESILIDLRRACREGDRQSCVNLDRAIQEQQRQDRYPGPQPFLESVELRSGDRLLLCTDGLPEMVDDATIAAELGRPTSAAEACRALIGLALDRGGKDNVTVVVADYRIPEGP